MVKDPRQAGLGLFANLLPKHLSALGDMTKVGPHLKGARALSCILAFLLFDFTLFVWLHITEHDCFEPAIDQCVLLHSLTDLSISRICTCLIHTPPSLCPFCKHRVRVLRPAVSTSTCKLSMLVIREFNEAFRLPKSLDSGAIYKTGNK